MEGTSRILDDVIITGKDDQEHLNHLEEVLKRLKEHELRAYREKCEFFQKKITYCGHVVDQDGLHKTQEKVDAVVHAPVPESVQPVRSFLGMENTRERSTSPFILRTGELLPQVPAKPGRYPTSTGPTFGARQSMEVDHRK